MQVFPFTALVGMDQMRLALILNAINPAIGGVLVRGEKGTAKSTAVRGLADVLPPITVVQGDPFNYDPASSQAPDGERITRPIKIVELPVGATNDRVTGSLDLEKALTKGQTAFEPGLLAMAHRGILYVDEVNLLGDHLVDLLLDSAAMGVNRVEREGVSISHPAQFQLIGTMNPEEGELRPQLLDRFGLSVTIAASRDPQERVQVVRRRLAFDANPVEFAKPWQQAQTSLANRIGHAKSLVEHVRLSPNMLNAIVATCAHFDVDGMRADLVTAKTAQTVAAWEGRDYVLKADVKIAALLALGHRKRRGPFEEPGIEESELDEVLAQFKDNPDDYTDNDDDQNPDDGPDDDPNNPDDTPDNQPEQEEDLSDDDLSEDEFEIEFTDAPDNENPADTDHPEHDEEENQDTNSDDQLEVEEDYEFELPQDLFDQLLQNQQQQAEQKQWEEDKRKRPSTEQIAEVAQTFAPLSIMLHGKGVGSYGRRSPSLSDRGVYIGHQPVDADSSWDLALVPTLRTMALRKAGSDTLLSTARFFVQTDEKQLSDGVDLLVPKQVKSGQKIQDDQVECALSALIAPQDWQKKILQGREGNLVLFCVDASGSMAAKKRMDQVKGVIVSLLMDAYQRRDRIGLITFRGKSAQVAMRPTNSIDLAVDRLTNLPTGGRTPLAEGLNLSASVIASEKVRDEKRRPLLIVITDGKATYPKQGAIGQATKSAQGLAGMGVPALIVDSEQTHIPLGLAKELAANIQGAYLPIEHLSHGLIQSLILSPTGASRMVTA